MHHTAWRILRKLSIFCAVTVLRSLEVVLFACLPSMSSACHELNMRRAIYTKTQFDSFMQDGDALGKCQQECAKYLVLYKLLTAA